MALIIRSECKSTRVACLIGVCGESECKLPPAAGPDFRRQVPCSVRYDRLSNIRLLLLATVLAFSTSTNAQRSTDSSGVYLMDLGQVYAGAEGMKQYRDICAEAFPVFNQQNEKAYGEWRRKYLSFLQELEQHFTAAAWREAKGDEAKYLEFRLRMSRTLDQGKKLMRKQLSDLGNEQFRKACSIYPQKLSGARANLEHFYAEQVVTIRSGPPK